MKFEYKIIVVDAGQLSNSNFQRELDQKFNGWGEEGWDLAKFEPIQERGYMPNGSYTREFIAIFKREKAEA